MSEAAKAQKQGVKIFPHPDAGKTRDKVAAAVGLGSGRTYETAKKGWEAARKSDETARGANGPNFCQTLGRSRARATLPRLERGAQEAVKEALPERETGPNPRQSRRGSRYWLRSYLRQG